MTTFRALRGADQQQAKEIWELRFDDSHSFIEWFFRERFSPETSFCAEEDGRIVAIAHGSDQAVRVRGTELPARMVSGVATLPGFEHRGLMKGVMRALFDDCRENGISLAFHTPSHFSIYRAIGEFPCSDALLHTRTETPAAPPDWETPPTPAELLHVYAKATARYSGCVARTESQMRRRIDDLMLDGGTCMLHRNGGEIDGYLFAGKEEDGALHCEEALAYDDSAYLDLMRRLPAGTSVKLPPDAPVNGRLYPQGVLIPVDVSALLRSLCGIKDAFRLAVTDSFLPWNNGVFDGAGNRVGGTPTDTLSAGRLMQFLCGYLPFRDVCSTLPCFCADEY